MITVFRADFCADSWSRVNVPIYNGSAPTRWLGVRLLGVTTSTGRSPQLLCRAGTFLIGA